MGAKRANWMGHPTRSQLEFILGGLAQLQEEDGWGGGLPMNLVGKRKEGNQSLARDRPTTLCVRKLDSRQKKRERTTRPPVSPALLSMANDYFFLERE